MPDTTTAIDMQPAISLSIHCTARGLPKPRVYWVIMRQKCYQLSRQGVSGTNKKATNITLQYNPCENEKNQSKVT